MTTKQVEVCIERDEGTVPSGWRTSASADESSRRPSATTTTTSPVSTRSR
ncbi:hypothetical protein NKG05_11150 [Oerskovia sp. M15]